MTSLPLEPEHSVAILHPHGGMGDLLLSYPVIDAFANAFPNSTIFYITPPGLEEVVRANPKVSKAVSLSPGFFPALHLAEWLRAKKTKIGCALWTTSRIAWLMKIAEIPVRIGQANRRLYSFLFTHPVPVRSASGDRESHWVECLLDYPRALGLGILKKEISVPVPREAKNRAEEILLHCGLSLNFPFLVFHCGKGRDVLERGWPVDLFAQAADQLTESGFSIVFTGSAREIPLVEAVQARMKQKGISVAGKTNFLSLAAILQLAGAVVCPDSGPMHLAAAVGTPVVAIFAMKQDFPNRWKPWGVHHMIIQPEQFPCRPWCTKENCPDFLCYREIPPSQIVDAVSTIARITRIK